MRDPKRIERTLGVIRRVWSRYPDLRLCQLLSSAAGGGDLFYLEDGDLEAYLLKLEHMMERPV